MDSDSDLIRQQAERWFARRRDGVRPTSEESEFQQWLQASPAHARAYAAAERSWQEMQALQFSPRMRELTSAAMRSTTRSAPPLTWWKPLLLVASVALVAVIGTVMVLPQLQREAPAAVAYRTALGEQRTEQLADGTRITLNTDTRLEVRYADDRRDVVLQQGEALFAVAKDAQRPFVVAAADGAVTALGTQFQVREQDSEVSVTLLEGRVEVTRASHAERQVLAPGDQVAYRSDTRGMALRQVDPARVISWTQGRLDFRGTPLAEAVAEANRYSALKLRLGDPGLADLPISGNFRTGDNAGIAAAVAAVFPVRIASNSDTEIVLQPRY